ncbi:MAG: RNA polymerase sigma factor [Kofleriaceae bacterium]
MHGDAGQPGRRRRGGAGDPAEAHRGLAGFRGDGTARAWLCGIARHVCVRRLAARKKHRAAARGGAGGRRRRRGVPQPSARARGAGGAAQLRPSDREPLVLRFVADLDYREVAAVLGVDEPAARKRVSRALAQLRATFATEELP